MHKRPRKERNKRTNWWTETANVKWTHWTLEWTGERMDEWTKEMTRYEMNWKWKNDWMNEDIPAYVSESTRKCINVSRLIKLFVQTWFKHTLTNGGVPLSQGGKQPTGQAT